MKKYIFEITEGETGLNFKSTNNGFNAYELLGFLEQKKQDIFKQLDGIIQPQIERVVKTSDEQMRDLASSLKGRFARYTSKYGANHIIKIQLADYNGRHISIFSENSVMYKLDELEIIPKEKEYELGIR